MFVLVVGYTLAYERVNGSCLVDDVGARVAALRAEGLSFRQVARELGVSLGGVHQALRRYRDADRARLGPDADLDVLEQMRARRCGQTRASCGCWTCPRGFRRAGQPTDKLTPVLWSCADHAADIQAALARGVRPPPDWPRPSWGDDER